MHTITDFWWAHLWNDVVFKSCNWWYSEITKSIVWQNMSHAPFMSYWHLHSVLQQNPTIAHVPICLHRRGWTSSNQPDFSLGGLSEPKSSLACVGILGCVVWLVIDAIMNAHDIMTLVVHMTFGINCRFLWFHYTTNCSRSLSTSFL